MMKNTLLILACIFSQNCFSQSDITKVTCTIEVPNTITPNSEVNDGWKINPTCPVTGFTVEVFNRWGQKVYTQDSLGKNNLIHWDFTLKGKALPEGTYFYIMQYKMKFGDAIEEKNENGTVSLIR